MGELIEYAFEMHSHIYFPFLKSMQTVIKMLLVCAPASEKEPKLTFRAITVGRRSRSARLLSAGTRLSSAQRYILPAEIVWYTYELWKTDYQDTVYIGQSTM